MTPGQTNQKTVLELDLAAYSDVASALEEHLDVQAVKTFQDQIQSFVDEGLNQLGIRRDDVVFATAGDNALLIFDDPGIMHQFAKIVQEATVKHNRKKSVESAKRWFRMGAATGAVLVIAEERRIVGTTVARAVRLEAAAEKGELLIDTETYDALPEEIKKFYGEEEVVAGKRDERFTVRRCALISSADRVEKVMARPKPNEPVKSVKENNLGSPPVIIPNPVESNVGKMPEQSVGSAASKSSGSNVKWALVAGVILAIVLGWYFEVEKPAEQAQAKKVADEMAQLQTAAQQAAEDKTKAEAEAARLVKEKKVADALAAQKAASDKAAQAAATKQAAEAKAKADADAETARLAEKKRKVDELVAQTSPAESEEAILGRIRGQLEFDNDTDWQAVKPLVKKVLDEDPKLGSRITGYRIATGLEAEALASAIDKRAAASQIHDFISEYKATHQPITQYADVHHARALVYELDLRAVLTVRQEAIATLMGLVNTP